MASTCISGRAFGTSSAWKQALLCSRVYRNINRFCTRVHPTRAHKRIHQIHDYLPECANLFLTVLASAFRKASLVALFFFSWELYQFIVMREACRSVARHEWESAFSSFASLSSSFPDDRSVVCFMIKAEVGAVSRGRKRRRATLCSTFYR